MEVSKGEVNKNNEANESAAFDPKKFGDDLMKGMMAALQSGAFSIPGSTPSGPVDSFSKVNPDDILDPPIPFYTPFANYILVDDKKNGQRVQLPFNMDKIVFKYDSTKKVPYGNKREEQILNISKYKCESKTIADWIRNCSFFNIMIFEKGAQALSADASLVREVISSFNQIKDLPANRVVDMLRGLGIEPDLEDANRNRTLLAEAQASSKINEMINRQRDRISSTLKHQMLLRDKSVESIDKLGKIGVEFRVEGK